MYKSSSHSSSLYTKYTVDAVAVRQKQAKSVAVPKQDALRLKVGGEQKLLPLIRSLFKAIVGSGILSSGGRRRIL